MRLSGVLLPCVLLLLVGCSRPDGGEANWVAMGTLASVRWRGVREFPQAADDVRATFARLEKLLNAHDPQSELSRLAPLPDAEILAKCAPDVRACYEAAFRLRDETRGAFNPRWRGPKTMDLGAIAKGFAVDRAAARLLSRGAGRSGRLLVDLGGNLKAAGGGAWTVGIAGSDETLVLTNGMACATSGEYYRGKHIRDGRTGAAVSNGVWSVTVVHPTSAMLADGLSTVLFILGPAAGADFLRRHYPETAVRWLDAASRLKSGDSPSGQNAASGKIPSIRH